MPYGKANPKMSGVVVTGRYEPSTYFAGVLGNSQELLRWTVTRNIRLLPALFALRAQSSSDASATAQAIILIKQNGTQIGTVTYAISATTGTFAFTSPISLRKGDVVTVVGPATADATLAGVSVTLPGIA